MFTWLILSWQLLKIDRVNCKLSFFLKKQDRTFSFFQADQWWLYFLARIMVISLNPFGCLRENSIFFSQTHSIFQSSIHPSALKRPPPFCVAPPEEVMPQSRLFVSCLQRPTEIIFICSCIASSLYPWSTVRQRYPLFPSSIRHATQLRNNAWLKTPFFSH